MGYGIALVAATKAKVDVKIMDVNQAQLDNSHAKAKKILQRDVQKGRLTEEEMEQAYGRLSHTTSLSDVSMSTPCIYLGVRAQLHAFLCACLRCNFIV